MELGKRSGVIRSQICTAKRPHTQGYPTHSGKENDVVVDSGRSPQLVSSSIDLAIAEQEPKGENDVTKRQDVGLDGSGSENEDQNPEDRETVRVVAKRVRPHSRFLKVIIGDRSDDDFSPVRGHTKLPQMYESNSGNKQESEPVGWITRQRMN
jgi:hypothetical protein